MGKHGGRQDADPRCICAERLREILGDSHPGFVWLAAVAEEGLEEGGGLGGEGAFDDFDAVVEEIGIGELEFGADAAEAEVAVGEYQGLYAGVDDGAGAHDAGFEGDVEGGVVEAVVLEGGGGGAEDVDFGVGGGVVGGDGGVVRAGDDFAIQDEHGADGDFARGLGFAGFGEGFAHVEIVIHILSLGGAI